MQGLLSISNLIDRITTFIGKSVSWLILVAVIISAGNAIIRKVFDVSSNAWLEAQWYLFGTVFMLATAYTLLCNEHVRIDVVSNKLSKATRDKVDLFCHIFFLLPFAFLMVYLSWPWWLRSFSSGEISPNAGGLIVWPAKFMVLFGFILLLCQAFSEIIKRYAVVKGIIDDATLAHDLPPTIEAGLTMEQDDIDKSAFHAGENPDTPSDPNKKR